MKEIRKKIMSYSQLLLTLENINQLREKNVP